MASEKDLLTDVLALPAEKRARIAHELLVSLDEQEDPTAADAWLAELDQRAREVENGTAELEDWEVVRERLARRWRSDSQR
ncbi:addiction module protein [Hyalangium sp.]|uniref:addiction module protein n=1 Tax=Hyalangium sp. TaxID=2028555 RepID=UPI002D6FE753|nr:addiction module protein [Hyalangium sp.]HYI02481.1 addiction module protein [Hyalangium sp.]